MLEAFGKEIRILGVRLIEDDLFAFRKSRFRIDLAGGNGDALIQFFPVLVAFTVHFLKLLLQVRIDGGVEQLLEERFPLIGGGIEDFQKVTLGDHDGR